MLSLSLATALISVSAVTGDNWDSWWTYEGISGPEYWGVLNQEWTMCNKGRSQSPVNINPGTRDALHTQAFCGKCKYVGGKKFLPEYLTIFF